MQEYQASIKWPRYEIALTEYSIALGYEMAERDPDIPADDLLFEVRSTLKIELPLLPPLFMPKNGYRLQ